MRVNGAYSTSIVEEATDSIIFNSLNDFLINLNTEQKEELVSILPDEYIDWYAMSETSNVSLDFLRTNKDKICWDVTSAENSNLWDEKILEEFKEYIFWGVFLSDSGYPVSAEFLEKNKEYILFSIKERDELSFGNVLDEFPAYVQSILCDK